MISTITSGILKTVLAVSLTCWVSGQATAQGHNTQLRTGKNLAGIFTNQTNPVSKASVLVSRPGNSQDFIALGPNQWQHESNSAYTYDSQGRLTQRLYSDVTTNQPLGREITVYDAQGNQVEYRMEEMQGGLWTLVDGYKSLYTYSAQGLKLETIFQMWNSSMNTWENDYKEEIAYDVNNLATSITNSSWDNNSWNLEDRMLLSNVGGTATSALVQEFTGSSWEDAYQITNLTWHTLYEIPSAYVLQIYDNNVWMNEIKYSSVYDPNGGHVGIYEVWDGTSNMWEKSSRETETYDINKNFTSWMEETWDAATASWMYEGENKEVLTYSGIDVTQRIFQDSWNPTNTLMDYRKEVYSNFQTFNISGIKEKAELTVTVYPNPTAGLVTISLPIHKGTFTANLTDVTGKNCFTKTFKAGETTSVNMEGLPKGIYLLHLQTETGAAVKRIVKQ